MRMAATTEETYPLVGRLGLPVFMALRTTSITDLRRFIGGYHAGWAEAGHPGRGSVGISMPVYVAETARQAREEPEASMMHFFRSISQGLKTADGATAQTAQAREARAQRLATLTYDDVLREQAIFGTPEMVTDRLLELRETLGFTSVSAWMNPGGQISHERVLTSMRLFTERVAPRLP
jgi:alkanesulfonate monooxygenase SsuD/methylene tetrahydromethanopterin reductase-like flavin-dependent oxidoreductase (luciferase family)